MSWVGINIGALTVKVAALRGDERVAEVAAHQGRPAEVLGRLLAGPGLGGGEYFGVSGRMGHVSESAAIQRALRETAGRFDAVASLGGESFLAYIVTDRRITNVLSHNKCAAGSGEFFVQQIGRMGLGMDDAISLSFRGRVVPLASRCSVHCKSDITHKLNRNEATPEDILHSLHDGMAGKVLALLEKGQRELGRVLLIGGLTHNAAMLASLRGRSPGIEFVVLPESGWFEAWGTALLTRDKPVHRAPRLSAPPGFSRLPPLRRYGDRVRVVAAAPCPRCPEGPLVLGVDAGSTTTKAILLDPATREMVAAHYTRTNGDPVAATRRCLQALAGQVGNRPVGPVGTTGSARELAGAYLGTGHVYNEISAHATGAGHFDREVDTIFEIGGQDSKYIHLRNGVPIDYAMNNACSAGTGSFLEESALGDLGLEVSAIAELALAAPSPVQFKATCAAFINSDIRIAQQEGHSREDIVAGLVYAIAANYLNRVKGSRCVGQKVFLQGGVALNRALGHAFAHSVGREIIIPPRPELSGALGVGLLALERAGGALESAGDLLALARPEMNLVGRFTCRACRMHCSIDRFEIGGRRFPFGGRCSLFENVWKRRSYRAAAPDLVQQRAAVIFSGAAAGDGNTGPRVGIPRALTTHSLHPLYSVFLSELGLQVVLSGVDPQGELASNAGFCFPAQIAHGAVLDLARRGVKLIFLPHVSHLRQATAGRDCHLCPVTQASPYFLSKAFLDIVHHYQAEQAVPGEPFAPCRLAGGGRVIRSDGELVPLSDPRVRIYFPNFSSYHAEAIAMATRWLGLHTGDVLPLDRAQLERGLQHSSGRECLPLPICIGQMLEVHEKRPPDEIAGFFMMRGGAPCAVDCYMGYFERFIVEQRLPDLFLLDPGGEGDRLGFDRATLIRHLTPAFLVADIAVELEQVLTGIYHGVAETAGRWGMKPGGWAFTKACSRMFQPDGRKYLTHWLSFQTERRFDAFYRSLFRRTGLLVAGPNDASSLFERASEHVSPAIFGEVVPTVGKGVEAASEGYDGILLIGPFNCLPYRISEAILKPHCIQNGMPILTYESDGYAVAPSFLRQVDVHIQQVTDRHARNREAPPAEPDGLAGIIESALSRTLTGRKQSGRSDRPAGTP